MENLWKKESNTNGSRYVNIFAGIHHEIDSELKAYRSQKDNQQSTILRSQGNEKFRIENWVDAGKLYNESLRYAECGSENIALAHANRSACLFHMNRYNDALVAIELAKNANLPERLLSKLDKRKQDCERLRLSVPRMPKHEIKLSYEANEKIPCMANVCEIANNKEFGRHLIANCDIPAGKIVLVEDAFVATMANYEVSCYTCHRISVNGIPCEQCPDVVFCSIDCMNQNKTHKWECGSFFNSKAPLETRFLVQTILLAIEAFGDIPSLMQFVECALQDERKYLPTSLTDDKSKYHFFFKLDTSRPYERQLVLDEFKCYNCIMTLPKVSALFDSEEKQCFLMHLATHHFLIRKTNGFGGGKDLSLSNVHSIINHSCTSNLTILNIAKKQFCITIRPVKKGDQLFINYMPGDSEERGEERQQKILPGWGFICKCEKCCVTTKAINKKVLTSNTDYRFVVEKGMDNNGSALVLKKCVKFLNKYGHEWSDEIEQIVYIYSKAMYDYFISEYGLLY